MALENEATSKDASNVGRTPGFSEGAASENMIDENANTARTNVARVLNITCSYVGFRDRREGSREWIVEAKAISR